MSDVALCFKQPTKQAALSAVKAALSVKAKKRSDLAPDGVCANLRQDIIEHFILVALRDH